ncbi:MAG TPA: MFS transporter [Candidatus Eisenbacteria bacterium]|nr:MFS transporter [Candidatus Eisenbacteria bacterium]
MGGAASLRLFRDTSFRALWIGQVVSVFGDRFTYLALLAVVIEHARTPANPAAELSWIPVVSFLPTILFGPWIGALVDTWDRKRVLVLSDAARGVVALLFLVVVPHAGLTGAFGLVFALYVANSFFLPARSAILPEMVPEDRLVEANSLVTLAGVGATIAGSLAGGVAIARFGWRVGFALDALTYFVSVVALLWIRVVPRVVVPSAPHPPHTAGDAYRALYADVREGARITLQSPRALGAIAATGLLWVAGGALHVAAPILLASRGHGIVAGVGTLLAATATGMVAGSLALAARGGGGSPWGRTAAGLAGSGAALLLFARSHRTGADLALGFGAGAFVALLLVTTEAALQGAIGPVARARVFALRDFTARLLVLASAGLCGVLLGRGMVRPEWAVAGAGALLIAGALTLAFTARARDRGKGVPA